MDPFVVTAQGFGVPPDWAEHGARFGQLLQRVF